MDNNSIQLAADETYIYPLARLYKEWFNRAVACGSFSFQWNETQVSMNGRNKHSKPIQNAMQGEKVKRCCMVYATESINLR